VDEFLDAIARELAYRHPGGESWPVETLYLGGGTPSLLGADGVARLLDVIRRRVTLAASAEVTLEANPDDVTSGAARAWRGAGVNRLSIGAQSFDDGVLAWMHRTHAAHQVARAVAAAREADIVNLSLDLIFALPGSLRRDWDRDLEAALELAPAHLSLYGLTVEPGTPLGKWRERGTVADTPDDVYEAEFLRAHERLGAMGYEHYEVSNYALSGRQSRHNSAYWCGSAYDGIGPAAHGYDGERRRWNVAAYSEWCGRLVAGSDPEAGSEVLSEGQRMAERLYLGLRTCAGVAVTVGAEERIARWVQAGWAVVELGTVRLTPLGWLRLDALAADLTPYGSLY
jgi:oxygen-independent coproporphyrinogen-3 oxidase